MDKHDRPLHTLWQAETLIAAAHEAGKDPVDYLNAVRIHQKEGSATE
jgi:hypothetical protein